VERPLRRVQQDIGDPDLGDHTAQLAAQRPRPDPHLVADIDRAGEQEDYAGEHVGEALLRGYADQHRGERAADEKLRDADAEQLQGDQDGGQATEQDDGVADDSSVGSADLRLQDLAGLGREPGRGQGSEQTEGHGCGICEGLGPGVAGIEKAMLPVVP